MSISIIILSLFAISLVISLLLSLEIAERGKRIITAGRSVRLVLTELALAPFAALSDSETNSMYIDEFGTLHAQKSALDSHKIVDLKSVLDLIMLAKQEGNQKKMEKFTFMFIFFVGLGWLLIFCLAILNLFSIIPQTYLNMTSFVVISSNALLYLGAHDYIFWQKRQFYRRFLADWQEDLAKSLIDIERLELWRLLMLPANTIIWTARFLIPPLKIV